MNAGSATVECNGSSTAAYFKFTDDGLHKFNGMHALKAAAGGLDWVGLE